MFFPEKLKLVRKAHGLTQAEFADSIGVSRGNLANIEVGKVEPTQVFINCVALTYHIDKAWLTDDSNDDLGALNPSTNMSNIIATRYDMLDDKYKEFVAKQINELLSIQKDPPPSNE